MYGKTALAALYIFITILIGSALAADKRTDIITEAEQLEISGEPLSAEIEYLTWLEENIKNYHNTDAPDKMNQAESEFLIEKILKLTEFTGDNLETLKSFSKMSANPADIPASLFSRLKLAELTLNLRCGKTRECAAITGHLQFADNLLIRTEENPVLIPFTTLSPDKALPLGKVIGKSTAETFTAFLLVTAREKTEAALNFGNSTPLDITLNSQKVFSSSAIRTARPDQQKIGVKLNKGINIFEFTCINKAEATLFIRLTRTDGSRLGDTIKYSSYDDDNKISAETLADLQKTTADQETAYDIPVDNGAEQILAEIIDNDKKAHRASYYLGTIILSRESLDGDIQPAQELLVNAARYSPENSIYLMTVAEAYDESERFRADQDNNMRRMSLKKAIKLNKDNILARIELARYYLLSQNSPDRAEEYIKEALKINPISAQANLLLYKLYKERSWSAQALRIAREIAKRDPDIPQAQKTLARALMDSSTSTDALHAFQAAYQKNMLDTQTAKNIFRLLLRSGNSDSAAKFAEKVLSIHPYDIDFQLEYIDFLLVTESASADKQLSLAENIFHNNADLLKLRGKYYDTITKEHEKALSCYQQALKISPADPELNNYFEFKGMRPSTPLTQISDINKYVQDKLSTVELNNADSAYILAEQYDRLNLDGTRSHTEQNIIKILTQNSADQMKRYPIWYDKETENTSIAQAKVFHQDGLFSIAQISDINSHPSGKGLTLLDFPALEAGDILQIEFTVNQIKPSFFGSYFGNIHRFSNSLPTVISKYILQAPQGLDLYFHRTGETPEAVINRSGKETIYTWTMQNIPAITDQPYSAPANEISSTIEISTFKDWDELARWYWQLVKNQNILSPEISAKVQELTLGCNNEKEKINAIYNWITMEIRNNAWEFGVHGYKPYNANTIFKRRFGDCKDKATLLNVMAGAAGIDAWPLLLRSTQRDNMTVSRGKEDLTLPLLSHFNHCISFVIADDEQYFLDSTMQMRTIDSNPATDAGAKAVIIRPDGAELTATPAPAADSERWIDYTGIGINAEGTADIDFTIATTGDSSMFLRAWFRNQASWDNVLRAICSERYGHVSAVVVDDFGTNETLDKDEVTLKGRVRIRNYANTTQDSEIIFSIPEPFLSIKQGKGGAFPARISDFAIPSKRSEDLILQKLFRVERHIKIEWPERWEIAERLPAPVNIDKPFGKLTINYEQINNTLKLDYNMELKNIRIPSKDYPEFRKFCLKADLPLLTSFTLNPAVKITD